MLVGDGLGVTVLVLVGVGLGVTVLVVVGAGVGKVSAAANPAVPNAIPPPTAIATKIGIVIFSLISDSPYGWRCGSWDISPGMPAKCSAQNPLYAPY